MNRYNLIKSILYERLSSQRKSYWVVDNNGKGDIQTGDELINTAQLNSNNDPEIITVDDAVDYLLPLGYKINYYAGQDEINEGLNLVKKNNRLKRSPASDGRWAGNWNASIGDLETSYQNLVNSFGEPEEVVNDKYDVEWGFSYGNIDFAIHNWQDGPSYDDGNQIEDIETWSLICSINPVPRSLIDELLKKITAKYFPGSNIKIE
jgi:hypothetical protein